MDMKTSLLREVAKTELVLLCDSDTGVQLRSVATDVSTVFKLQTVWGYLGIFSRRCCHAFKHLFLTLLTIKFPFYLGLKVFPISS